MKIQISSIIGGLILTLATSSGLAVSAKSLLSASKHSDSFAERGMPLTKVSKSGLKELAEMEVAVGGGVNWRMAAHKLNSTETGGVVNALNLGQDGTVSRAAFKIPESGVPIASIQVQEGGMLMLNRTFNLPSGKVGVTDWFTIGSFEGKTLRHTWVSELTTEKINAQMVLTNAEGRALKIYLQKGAEKPRRQHEFSLPDKVKGEIIHFEMSTSGSRVTALTSRGQQVEFTLYPNPKQPDELISKVEIIRPAPKGLKDLEAAVKIIPGRKSVSSASADVRGLEVQGNRAAQ